MGVGGQRHALATLPAGKCPGTHCKEGWVGLGGLVRMDEEKSLPYRGSNREMSNP
jgi:hypothetical protein